MSRALNELRPVYVVGIGWHRYQNPSEIPYVTLGLTAIRQALTDARIDWPAVEPMLRQRFSVWRRVDRCCGTSATPARP